MLGDRLLLERVAMLACCHGACCGLPSCPVLALRSHAPRSFLFVPCPTTPAGGELFYRIVEMGHFSEVYASRVMGELLRGVKALHDAGIIRTCPRCLTLVVGGCVGAGLAVNQLCACMCCVRGWWWLRSGDVGTRTCPGAGMLLLQC